MAPLETLKPLLGQDTLESQRAMEKFEAAQQEYLLHPDQEPEMRDAFLAITRLADLVIQNPELATRDITESEMEIVANNIKSFSLSYQMLRTGKDIRSLINHIIANSVQIRQFRLLKESRSA